MSLQELLDLPFEASGIFEVNVVNEPFVVLDLGRQYQDAVWNTPFMN